LRPVLAIRQVSPAVRIAAGRVLRCWYRAKRLTKQIIVQRVERALLATSTIDAVASANKRSRGGRARLSVEQRCGLRFHFAAVY
jgi:hypothetical protein